MSATSSRPALAACTASPAPGLRRTIVGSAMAAISISDCPTPTRLQHDQVVRQRREQSDGGGHRSGQPAQMTARRHGPDQHVGVVDMCGHSNPVAEQRAPAVGRRRVDGEHGDPLLPFAIRADQRPDGRRLARARRTCHTDDPRRRRRAERVEHLATPWTFDQAQQPAGRPDGSVACRVDELVDGHWCRSLRRLSHPENAILLV